jgi:excisionase family DNA binding protein
MMNFYKNFRLLLKFIDWKSIVLGSTGTERVPAVRRTGSGREAQAGRAPAEGSRAAMDELLTPEQAAAILQLSPKTLKDWLRAGKLPGCKIGRFWRVKPADLEAFIRASRLRRGREEPADPRQDC